MKEVKMKIDRDLLDTNFSGYKLNLDGLVTRSIRLDGPEHRLPSSHQYSFLHAKLYGEQNQLVLDPWDDVGDTVYLISSTGAVLKIELDQVVEVWLLQGAKGEEGSYNNRLMFLGERLACITDGEGVLYLLDTGDRRNMSKWSEVFREEICGRDRPFQVVTGGLVEGELEVVVHYVEENDKVEGISLPKVAGDSAFLNVLEWISLSGAGGMGWVMERVRRIVSRGGVNYVGLSGGKLVVRAEKEIKLIFDSMRPLTDEISQLEIDQSMETPASFYWRQEGEDLEVWSYVSEVSRQNVKVILEGNILEVRIREVCLFTGHLWSAVDGDSWTWTLDGGKLTVLLVKTEGGFWPDIWGGEGGSKGQVVTEVGEDNLLPHLTTDKPIIDIQSTDNQPGFNTDQLEDCDNCDISEMMIWIGDNDDEEIVSHDGDQHLLTVPRYKSSTSAICMRHDVDGLVWEVEKDQVKHVATFPALGYVQASKTSRKYISAPPSCEYSVICDNMRHVYIYRQPTPLAEEIGLRNRRSGQKVERVARQQVVTLDTKTEIVGMVATDKSVFVVTRDQLYTIHVGTT